MEDALAAREAARKRVLEEVDEVSFFARSSYSGKYSTSPRKKKSGKSSTKKKKKDDHKHSSNISNLTASFNGTDESGLKYGSQAARDTTSFSSVMGESSTVSASDLDDANGTPVNVTFESIASAPPSTVLASPRRRRIATLSPPPELTPDELEEKSNQYLNRSFQSYRGQASQPTVNVDLSDDDDPEYRDRLGKIYSSTDISSINTRSRRRYPQRCSEEKKIDDGSQNSISLTASRDTGLGAHINNNEDDDDDDEFLKDLEVGGDLLPELAARARRQRQESESGNDLYDRFSRSRTRTVSSGPPFIVDVLVETNIPVSIASVDSSKQVKRKAFRVKSNYEFRKVRLAWQQNSELPAEIVNNIVFLHKDNYMRVYDHVTPSILGVQEENPELTVLAVIKDDVERLREEFRLTGNGDDIDEGNGEAGNAITSEKSDYLGISDSRSQTLGTDSFSTIGTQDDTKASDEGLRIFLQDRDGDKFKVIVKPDTNVSKIISFYRQKKGLPVTASITLEMDNEKIDPNDVVSQTELEDEVTIDVIR
ncbi:ubiquitin-2 like Rad60 SUMO-like-domain-containing protein [Dipodascopsis uninucleata]